MSCRRCERALQLQGRQVEVFLAAERQLIRGDRVQLFIRRDSEVHVRHSAHRRRGMLRNGHEREVAERRPVVAPAQALGWIGISAVVLKSMPQLGSCGVIELASACTFCVPRITNLLDGSNPSALTRINPKRRSRSGFSSVANAGLVSATKADRWEVAWR